MMILVLNTKYSEVILMQVKSAQNCKEHKLLMFHYELGNTNGMKKRITWKATQDYLMM